MKVYVESLYISHIDTSTREGKSYTKGGTIEACYLAIINSTELKGTYTMPYDGIVDIPLIEYNIIKSLQTK